MFALVLQTCTNILKTTFRYSPCALAAHLKILAGCGFLKSVNINTYVNRINTTNNEL